MTLPKDFGPAADEFAIGIVTGRMSGFLKRRKLKAAYENAAVMASAHYQRAGIRPEHPSWLGISRLIGSAECGAALSMADALTNDVLDNLQGVYAQDDPLMEEILRRLASRLRTLAKDILPVEFKNVEDLLATRLNLALADTKRVGEQSERESVRSNERQIERMGDNPTIVGVSPVSESRLFGRDQLLSDMTDWLISGDSIALSAQGMAGVGKTRLAMALTNSNEILGHFSDGILWAGLGPDADVMRHLATWADFVGIDVTGIPTEEERSKVVKNAIAHRKMLLVIDDAWDLNAANLLKCGGPNCAHLLTTRNQEIAHAFAGPQGTRNIPALEESAAFEMLKALAPAVCEADPETGQKLAEAVGGLPLALELLGRYLAPQERSAFPRLSAEAFSDMADPNRRLELAQHRLGDIASSEKPLSEIIGLSLEDLPEEAVNAFHALGAFASKPESFDLDAAVAVAGVNAQTLDLLNSRSLMEKIGERFSLHQTLADLARQKMPSEASNRHWDHYLALINENREDWQRIESEYPQIKWAWGKAEKSERLLDMIYALRIYRVRRGLWHDELDWSNIGLKIFEEHGMRGRSATLLNNIGMAYDSLGQQDKALEFFNQALPVIHEEGNRTGLAVTLNNIAGVYFAQGRQEQGLEFLNQALGIREEAGDRAGVATTLNNIGMAHSSLGRQEKALEFFEKALPIRREVGDRAGLATTLNNIAGVYSNLGQVEKALEFYNQALPITDEVGDRAGMATILNNIGMVHNSLDQRDKAIEFFNQALEILDEVENRPGLAATLNNIARAYYALGQPENALERFNRALAITNELGDRAGLAVLLNTIGNVYNSLGQRDTAMEIFNRTLPIMDEVGNQAGLIATLNDIAGVYFAVGQKDKALEFFSRALPIIDEAGDLFEEGATRYKMASVYISDGNLKDAEPHLQRAVEALTAAQAPELEMVQNTLTEVQDRLAEEGSVTD